MAERYWVRCGLPCAASLLLRGAIRPAIVEHWSKSVLFKDYGPHLDEAFAESLDDIAARNGRLIDAAARASQIRFIDEAGNTLTGSLAPDQKWTSVDGMGNLDVVPGEIATHVTDLNGSVVFSGTFLGTVPFAIKYKVAERLAQPEGRGQPFERRGWRAAVFPKPAAG